MNYDMDPNEGSAARGRARTGHGKEPLTPQKGKGSVPGAN